MKIIYIFGMSFSIIFFIFLIYFFFNKSNKKYKKKVIFINAKNYDGLDKISLLLNNVLSNKQDVKNLSKIEKKKLISKLIRKLNCSSNNNILIIENNRKIKSYNRDKILKIITDLKKL